MSKLMRYTPSHLLCKAIPQTPHCLIASLAGYPEAYFGRLSMPQEVVLRLINCIRADDIYNQTSFFPGPEHRTTALSSQVTGFAVCFGSHLYRMSCSGTVLSLCSSRVAILHICAPIALLLVYPAMLAYVSQAVLSIPSTSRIF